MNQEPTQGDNRTGIATNQRQADAMLEGTLEFPPSSTGSLHPDDQYLVLLELLGDLHAVYGANADTAAPDSKSIPESKSTPTVAAATRAAAAEPAPSSSEPPPSPKRKAPARKSAKSG